MSRSQRILFLFILAVLLGIAAGQELNLCVKKHEVNYDELHWEEPFSTGNPIPDSYKGLEYNIFQVDRYDGFIIPDSGLQYAMSFEGRGNISVSAQNMGEHSFFSPKSFSYACSGGVPRPECAIDMWGLRSGRVVAHQVISFPALGPGHFPSEFIMNSTTLDWRWEHLTSVGFAISRMDNGGIIYSGLMIDNLRYTITGDCSSCSTVVGK